MLKCGLKCAAGEHAMDAQSKGLDSASRVVLTVDGFSHTALLSCSPNGSTVEHPSTGHPARARIGRSCSMVELEKSGFDVAAFLASAGLGRRIVQLAPREAFFSQGDLADSVFYLQTGRARVTVVSTAGKEATIMLVASGDFVGEAALATVTGLRLSTATAVTACTALRIK